jgi:hypothetical protein
MTPRQPTTLTEKEPDMSNKTNELALTKPEFLGPVLTVEDALIAFQRKKDLIDKIFTSGIDYGTVIPNDPKSKPTLLKAGAEKAASFFGLHPINVTTDVVHDWTGEQHGGEPFIFYQRTCNLYRGDVLVASLSGSCNSWEKKYRYRFAERTCPVCHVTAIIKGKEEFGGGWVCYKKKGGCGQTFPDNSPEIVSQEVGYVPNPDIPDLDNTILKMADKRALVAAILVATGLSEYFTQDAEDFLPGEVVEERAEKAAQKNAPENHNQATGQPAEPKVLLNVFSEKLVGMAADFWHLSMGNAAFAIGQKLPKGSKMTVDEFGAWLKDQDKPEPETQQQKVDVLMGKKPKET